MQGIQFIISAKEVLAMVCVCNITQKVINRFLGRVVLYIMVDFVLDTDHSFLVIKRFNVIFRP